jgi:hypothetical protein
MTPYCARTRSITEVSCDVDLLVRFLVGSQHQVRSSNLGVDKEIDGTSLVTFFYKSTQDPQGVGGSIIIQ